MYCLERQEVNDGLVTSHNSALTASVASLLTTQTASSLVEDTSCFTIYRFTVTDEGVRDELKCLEYRGKRCEQV